MRQATLQNTILPEVAKHAKRLFAQSANIQFSAPAVSCLCSSRSRLEGDAYTLPGMPGEYGAIHG